MKKTIFGALAGYVIWSILWVGINALLQVFFPGLEAEFEETKFMGDVSYLGLALLGSVLCSLLAGRVSGRLGRPKGVAATRLMALLLLLTGIAVQAGFWSQMPLWYHLSFLVLIAPVCLLAGPRASQE